jgi:hypothetical protein
VSGTGIRAIAKPDEMTAGKTVTTTVKVDTNPNTNWIPAGNEISWHWELSLADGTTTVSKDQSFVYLPPNKDWKTVANEDFTIYFTGTREALANRFLQAMTDTYQKHGKTLLKADIPKRPVKLLLMADAKELQESAPSKGSTIDNSRVVVTCGFRPGGGNYLINDLIFAAISCGGSDGVDTVRHEFAHILNASAGESTLVKLPVWLDEGLAVYAQEAQDEYTAAFRAAAQSSRGIIPFRQMSTPTADQNQIILQYGQAYTMTKYLIDKYGPGKLNQLLALTKKNTRFDEALKQTYAFDMDGFEKEFKAALTGTRPAATPAATERPQQQPTARATAAATQAAAVKEAKATSSDDSGISRTTVAIIGVAVLFALLGVFAFLVMMFLQNQRRGPA